MVSFTGSSHVGRRIGELAGKHLKKVQLELGGKNAVIVLEDADLDAAASAIAFGAWFHQGQICMTTGRVLAKDKIAASLTAKLVAKANHLPVGDPLGQVALGPMISGASPAHRRHRQGLGGGGRQARGRRDLRRAVLPADRADRREARHARIRGGNLRTSGLDHDASPATTRRWRSPITTSTVSRPAYSRPMSAARIAIGNRLNTGLLHINDQTVADEPHVPFGGRALPATERVSAGPPIGTNSPNGNG